MLTAMIRMVKNGNERVGFRSRSGIIDV